MDKNKEQQGLVFSDIAEYLQYNLKFLHHDDEREITSTCEMRNINLEEICISNNEYDYDYNIGDHRVSPLLYPMDSIIGKIRYNDRLVCPIKEIFNLGQPVVSIHKTRKSYQIVYDINGEHVTYTIKKDILTEPYWVVQKLLSMKIDVKGLIEKGLAMPDDING